MTKQLTVKDSKVSEHLDTKSTAGWVSTTLDPIVILVKWRPLGRARNLDTMEWNSQLTLRSRDPVSLGDVEGAFHHQAHDQSEDLPYRVEG